MVQTCMYKEIEHLKGISGAERNHVFYLNYITKIQYGVALNIMFHQ